MENTELSPDEIFADVLDKDEKIIKMYKPDKKKFYWSVRWVIWLSLVWLYAFAFIAFDPEVRGNTEAWEIVIGMIILVTLLIIIVSIITRIFTSIYHKNRFYAFTNKRILIRSGVFGIDYKSLEFKSLTATIVKVSLLDKLIKHKTGTIIFGSPSSPVSGMFGQVSVNPYRFAHIHNPYQTLKEIKEVINKTDS